MVTNVLSQHRNAVAVGSCVGPASRPRYVDIDSSTAKLGAAGVCAVLQKGYPGAWTYQAASR